MALMVGARKSAFSLTDDLIAEHWVDVTEHRNVIIISIYIVIYTFACNISELYYCRVVY